MMKRLLIALGAGIIIALLDIWFTSNTIADVWGLASPMFWYMFTNRIAIGFFVAIAGIVTLHPLFGFKMFPVRGAFVGIWISLSMAASIFFDATATWGTFWMIIAFGAIYGIIIDVLATTLAGQGKALLHPNNE